MREIVIKFMVWVFNWRCRRAERQLLLARADEHIATLRVLREA